LPHELGQSGTYALTVNDLWDELHSVFIDWPDEATIDEPEVRYVRGHVQTRGVTTTTTSIFGCCSN
jgi:hypothetical protein